MTATFSDTHKYILAPEFTGAVTSYHAKEYAANVNGLWAYSGPMIACIDMAESTASASTPDTTFRTILSGTPHVRSRVFVPRGYDRVGYALCMQATDPAQAGVVNMYIHKNTTGRELGTYDVIAAEAISVSNTSDHRELGTFTGFDSDDDGMAYVSIAFNLVNIYRASLWLETTNV